jgi:hypothetical protein
MIAFSGIRLSACDFRTNARAEPTQPFLAIFASYIALPAVASRAAAAHDFITALPAGYDTVVGEQGRLVEQGRHDALYGQGGLYARLYDLQGHDGRSGE